MADSFDPSMFVIPPPPGSATGPRNDVKAMTIAETPEAIVEAIAFARAYQRVEGVAVYRCECQRCPKVWFTLQQTRPKTCPACRTAWWDRPRSPNQAPPPGMMEKPKKKKSVKGGKVGRPRKNAVQKVEPARPVERYVAREEEIPEVPVALLGAMGGFEAAPGQGIGRTTSADEEEFPVATPFNGGIPLPVMPARYPDPAVAPGQPADDRGSTPPADPSGDPTYDFSWKGPGMNPETGGVPAAEVDAVLPHPDDDEWWR